MNIRAVIKFYFTFVMVIVSIAALGYNPEVQSYMVNTFGITLGDEVKLQGAANFDTNMLAKKIATESDSYFFATRGIDPDDFNLTVVNDDSLAFAAPGDLDKEIMRFEMGSPAGVAKLTGLNLKLEGADNSDIKGLRLIYNDEVIGGANLENDLLKFGSIDLEMQPGEKYIVSLRVDLSENLKTGQRLRFDIAAPEDIKLLLDGKKYELSKYYPFKGEYLTIARQRPVRSTGK